MNDIGNPLIISFPLTCTIHPHSDLPVFWHAIFSESERFNPNNDDIRYSLPLTDEEKDADNKHILTNFTYNFKQEEYERTDDFGRIQEESNRLRNTQIGEYHKDTNNVLFGDDARRTFGRVYSGLLSRNNGTGYYSRADLGGKGNVFAIGLVHPKLFHDIFEINRKYLPNGELDDLHDDYSECKCFISNDGLCGFAIEPDGNLISLFSLNPRDRRGFLYAINGFIRKEGANHLDCYVSNKQNLEEIYKKTIGFHTASIMDYNMAYDHDDIAENHSNPSVAFMVDHKVETRMFDKDSYDEAQSYQMSQLSIHSSPNDNSYSIASAQDIYAKEVISNTCKTKVGNPSSSRISHLIDSIVESVQPAYSTIL